MRHNIRIGQIIHGFCGGAFGGDSYACRRVEAVGADWIVTRSASGVELAAGDEELRIVAEETDNRSWCSDDCEANS